jgi:hypothetical protein
LRDELELSALEALDARVQVYRNLGIAGIGCVSVAIAVIIWIMAPGSGWVSISGWIYSAIAVTETAARSYGGRE